MRADKQREVRDGHDGTWVAHPALVTVALEVFNQGMPAPNQIGKARDDVQARLRPSMPLCKHSLDEAARLMTFFCCGRALRSLSLLFLVDVLSSGVLIPDGLTTHADVRSGMRRWGQRTC